MTIREAAIRLGISPGSVRALIKAGKLPCYRPGVGGRKIVLDVADVERHLAASRHEQPPVEPTPAWVARRPYWCRYL